jgi:hypothetical protein
MTIIKITGIHIFLKVMLPPGGVLYGGIIGGQGRDALEATNLGSVYNLIL